MFLLNRCSVVFEHFASKYDSGADYELLIITWLRSSRWPRLAERVMFRSVRPSVRLSLFFLTLIGHAAHTEHDSPGCSTRRGQRAFPSEY